MSSSSSSKSPAGGAGVRHSWHSYQVGDPLPAAHLQPQADLHDTAKQQLTTTTSDVILITRFLCERQNDTNKELSHPSDVKICISAVAAPSRPDKDWYSLPATSTLASSATDQADIWQSATAFRSTTTISHVDPDIRRGGVSKASRIRLLECFP